MGALIVQDDALEQISFMLDKHESLVWYARKPPASDTDFWDKLPADVKKHALDVRRSSPGNLPGRNRQINL